jgi:hypothetical protein
VTKSGSNKFEFEFNATADSNRLAFFKDQGDNGAATYYYALNPTVAGPIVKDRLWYFFNAEAHFIQNNRNFDPAGIFPERPPYDKFIPKGTFKLTWQVTRRNKLTSLSNFDAARVYNGKNGAGVEPEAQERELRRRLFTGLIWESLLSDSLVLRSQAGFTYFGEHIFPELCLTDPECDHIAPVRQSFPQAQQWVNDERHLRNDSYHTQFINRLDWFINSKTFGEHNMKFQSTVFNERDVEMSSVPGDRLINYNGTASSGSGQREPQNQTTYYSNDPRVADARYGWYIQEVNWMRHVGTISDAYRATRYLTIAPAISHIYGKSFNAYGAGSFNQGAFSPAISFAWDATHDGRTVLRGSYSAFGDVDIKRFAEHAIGSRVSQRCDWNPDNQQFDKNCTYSGGASRNTIGLPCGSTGIDDLGRDCREKLQIPRTYELTMGAEREVVPGIAIGLDGVYKAFRHQFDTRETNYRWNASGTGLQVGGNFKNGRNQTTTDLATPDWAKRNWMGTTLSARKREGRFRVQATYTLSKLVGANGRYGDNPGQDIYLWGYLPDDHRHEIKALSTYQLTNWLTTGIRYTYRSGTPYNRIYRNPYTGEQTDYRAPLGISPGNNINDPNDDRDLRLPDLMSFNLQARVNLLPFIGQRLELFVDVLNVLATRTVTDVEENDGPAFGRPADRQDPFRIRLGLNYKY